MSQQTLKVDGITIKEGVTLIGEAERVPNADLFQAGNSYRCLANVLGTLCLIEISTKGE